jgi:hypothetical protein
VVRPEAGDGQALSDAALTEMLTPPDGLKTYAYGWWTGNENGHPVAAKDGDWPGSPSRPTCGSTPKTTLW